jgi:hypothetical protein
LDFRSALYLFLSYDASRYLKRIDEAVQEAKELAQGIVFA